MWHHLFDEVTALHRWSDGVRWWMVRTLYDTNERSHVIMQNLDIVLLFKMYEQWFELINNSGYLSICILLCILRHATIDDHQKRPIGHVTPSSFFLVQKRIVLNASQATRIFSETMNYSVVSLNENKRIPFLAWTSWTVCRNGHSRLQLFDLIRYSPRNCTHFSIFFCFFWIRNSSWKFSSQNHIRTVTISCATTNDTTHEHKHV